MTLNIRLKAESNKLTILEQPLLTSGTENIAAAVFEFDEAWDGYIKTAVFESGSVAQEVLLADNECTIPWEALTPGNRLSIGVYGVSEEKRLPTIYAHTLLVRRGAERTESAKPPTPGIYEQLLNKIGDLSALSTTDKSSLVAAINEIYSSGGGGVTSVTDAEINAAGHLIITLSDGTTLDAGYAVGPQGEAGIDGADGLTGQPGADGATFTPSVSDDGTLSWANDGGLNNPAAVNIKGPQGAPGADGENGVDGAPGTDGQDGANGSTFTPAVSPSGVISWTNDGSLPNPASIDLVVAVLTAMPNGDEVSY